MSANLDGSFPSEWFSKLDDYRECFNLLGDGKRFYQHKKDKDKNLSANYLVQEIPTGTNFYHFRHSTDEVNGLCPACCAMGLLRLPCFATSGGRGKPPGVNSKPPIYAIFTGASLAKTLQLSWWSSTRLGTPAWETPDMPLPGEGEVPLLMGLTWLPRRVWLGNPEETEDCCISCGRREHLIRKTVFAPIGSTKTDDDAHGRTWKDPHVIYAHDSKGIVTSLHARNVLGASDAAAGQWAEIVTGILQEQEKSSALQRAIRNGIDEDANVHVWIVSFSTVKNDKYLEATENLITLPNLNSIFPESIKKIERWQKEGSSLTRKPKIKRVETPQLVAAIRPHVESIVSTRAGELIAGTDEGWEQAAAEYRPMMKMIAKSLSPGFTAAAVQRRRAIAELVPDMWLKAEVVKATGRKKGGCK